MVRLSKNTRDRSVSPRRPKALLPKPKMSTSTKQHAQGYKKHENAAKETSVSSLIFVPRVRAK